MVRIMIAAALALAAWAAAALEGGYVGVGPAEGMALELRAARGGYEGAVIEIDGARAAFDAEAVGDGAEGTLILSTGRYLMRLAPQSVGLAAVMLPIDDAGAARADQAAALAFRRRDVAEPDAPTRWLDAPSGPVGAIDARGFVSSYPFWTAQAAAWGYEAVRPALRSVIRLHPHVQADLLWKLCEAPRRGAALAEALSGQGVTCADVRAARRRAEAGSGFNRFKRAVAAERAELMTALACAENFARNKPSCAASAEQTAARAVAMETARTVLRRY